MVTIFDKIKRKYKRKGEIKGEIKGKIEGIILILENRFQQVPEEILEKIKSITSLEVIDALFKKALNCMDLDEFFRDL